MIKTPRNDSPTGFTLAELIVGTTLFTIVMASVYTVFSTAVGSWRAGETNYQVYKTARLALGMMSRELQAIPPGTQNLFFGESDELTFYALTEPLEWDEEVGTRVYEISYSLSAGDRRFGRELVRVERPVESALPTVPCGSENAVDYSRTKLGRANRFVIADGVVDFQVKYVWLPDQDLIDATGQAMFTEPQEWDYNPEGFCQPQALRLKLILQDPSATNGTAEFETIVGFRGPTSPVPAEVMNNVY